MKDNFNLNELIFGIELDSNLNFKMISKFILIIIVISIIMETSYLLVI